MKKLKVLVAKMHQMFFVCFIYDRLVVIFCERAGPHFDLYQSLNQLPI